MKEPTIKSRETFDIFVSPIHHCMKNDQIRNFFWSVFSPIRIEHGELQTISPYSVRMRENTDQKKLPIWTLFTQCNPE